MANITYDDQTIGKLNFEIDIKGLSLWAAIKIRIAGLYKYPDYKVSIESLIRGK
jgi:hypothetical protein